MKRKNMTKILAASLSFALAVSAAFGGMPRVQAQTQKEAGQAVGGEQEAANEYAAMRKKFFDMAVGGEYDPNEPGVKLMIDSINETAQLYWEKMNKAPVCNAINGNYLNSSGVLDPALDASKDYIFAEYPLGHRSSDAYMNANSIHFTFQYIRAMALAYQTKGCGLYQNKEMLADIKDAIAYVWENHYNGDSTVKYGNWFSWELGAPIYFGETLILLYDEFDEAEVKKYAASTRKFLKQTGYTGANATWCMRAHMYGAILSEDESYFAVIRKTMPEVLQYSTSGDGYYTDGTFVQHVFYPYNGGYGLMCLTDTALLFHMLAGTQWDLGQENAELVYQWVKDSYEPIVYNGLCMDMYRGREITRTDTTQPRGGLVIANAMLMLAEAAPKEIGDQFKGVIKQWFSNPYMMDQMYNSADTPWYKFPLDTVVKVSNIMEDESIKPISFDGITYQMNAGARTVHWSKGGWTYGISMASRRIKTYEVGDSNRYGHYTGNGATYLYNKDLERYDGLQKPTMDWYRLPGATAIYKNRQAVQYNQNSFTGGVTDGAYGVTGTDMAFSNKLSAKKSWFLFDDEVVALGSNINGPGQVETTLENYMLKEGNRTYRINGEEKEMAMDGQEIEYSDVKTLHMQGNIPQTDIGFYFPGSTALTAKSEVRKGKWTDLGEYNTDPSEQQAGYFTVWQKHSQDGQAEDASYAYVLLPDKSEGETQAYAADSDVEILRQDGRAHAVYEKTMGTLGVNFWQDGYNSIDLGGVKNYLTCDSAATVMVTEDDDALDLVISDTTWENPGYINVELNRAAKGVLELDDGMEVLQMSPSIKLRINVNRAMGKNFRAKFSYDAVELSPVAITKVGMDGDDLQVTIEKSANADSYLVQVGTESGHYTKTVETKKNVVTIYGLTPGETYYLAAQAKNGDSVSGLGEEASYTIPGMAEFHDEFENFDKMLSYTSAWGLDAGNPGNFNGDITRIKRNTNTVQSFTYMLPGLQEFHLETYGYDKDLGVIRLYTSEDGVSWTEQEYDLLGITPTTAWFREMISTPESGVNKGANYLKVEVEKHRTKAWAPQFTKFDATMRSNSDRKTIKDTLLNEGRLYEASNVEFVSNSDAEAFGGDTDLVRATAADNGLLYSWTNIQDAEVSAYVKDGGRLLAYASEDGEAFVAASVAAESQGAGSAGYTKTVFSIPCKEDGRNYLKLVLEGDIVLSDVTFDYKPDNVPVQKVRFADSRLDGVIGYDAVPLVKTAPMNGVSELNYGTDDSEVAKYNNGTLQFLGQGDTKAAVTVSGAAVSAELPLTVYKDMCLNKPVSASSAHTAYPTSHAVDTNTTVTRWQSNTEQAEWFQVDMGEGTSFDAIDIQWYSNGEDYDLLVSDDGTEWKTLKEMRGQESGGYVRFDFPETMQARYLKMQGISESQYSFFSIRALQKKGDGSAPDVEAWNMAIGKKASCSSYDTGGAAAYPESNAIDGNTGTRWASARSDDQWYMVDLGETSTVEKINILWEAAAGKEYKVQISDDAETWTDMVYEKNNTGAGWKNYTLPQSYDGRYVRMLGIKRVSQYGYSMYEFEIIGTNANATTVQKIDEISVEPQELSLLPGQTAPLSVRTKPEVNSISIGWKSTNPELVSVTQSGTVTAKGSAGTASVIAYSILDESVQAACEVKITAYAGEPVKVESVKLKTPGEAFWCGNTYDLAADILPENATNKALTYTSSNPKVASVSVSGRLTAITAGKAVITVRSVSSGLTDTMEIEVRDADREAVDAAIQKIEGIGTVTLESEAAIQAARQAYDALTAAQKELVGQELAEILEAAEARLNVLKQEAADQEAVNAAIQKIEGIGTVTLGSEAAIQAARQAYDALTEAQKELVSQETVGKLEAAEARLNVLKQEAADQEAADAAIQKIEGIGTVTLGSEAAIQAARQAYDALTAAQKELVSQETVGKLEAAEARLNVLKQEAADQEAADTVSRQIEGIGTVTLESEAAIQAARQAYDALTAAQKKLVSQETVRKLEAAEARLIVLKQEAADQEAADVVSRQIEGIGTVTLGSEEAIVSARQAYDALTVAQKELVSQETVGKLEAAEARLNVLKQEAADQEAADVVSRQIEAIGEVTVESEEAIVSARQAYDALTAAQKKWVSAGTLALLEQAEQELVVKKQEAADLAAAKAVEDKIAGIGQVTLESGLSITEARNAYEALTDTQKALVPAGALEVLANAEAEWKALKDQAEQDELDQAAANAVIQKIAGIGSVTLGSETVIAEARAAYEGLTAAQKALVGQETLGTLEEAEALLQELKEEEERRQADREAANKVKALIRALGNVTLASKAQIIEARAAYEALTGTQKELVGEALHTLEVAEATLEFLETEAKPVQIPRPQIQVKSCISKNTAGRVKISFAKPKEGQKIAVYRKVGTKVTLVGQTTAGVLYDSKPASGKKAYYYAKAIAVDTAKYKDSENSAQASLSIPSNTSKVTAKQSGANRVKVTWKKVNGAAKYYIYRSEIKDKGFVKIATVSASKLSYLDKKAKAGHKYYYKVVTEKKSTYSSGKASKAAAVAALPPNTKKVTAKQSGAKGIKVTWKKAKGASTYHVYRSVKKDKGFVKIAKVSASKLSYLDKKAKAGKKYYYKVVTEKKGLYSSGKVSNAVKVKK